MNREEVIAASDRLEVPTYARAPIVADRGEGAWIFDTDGTRYLDLYGGHAVAVLGHSPRSVVDAIAQQAERLLFYSNVVHLERRARAAERLASIAPFPGRVYFANSGTEANETALKIARQATNRRVVVTFEGAFHGRTLGAVAASGLPRYRAAAESIMDTAAYRLVPFGDAEAAARAIDGDCAAVVVEPIQSMAGVRTLDPDFTDALRDACDRTGALLVFDEVQTAPARTGSWFFDAGSVTADMITCAKGIAAGFPAGLVWVAEKTAQTVRPGDQGSTFGGGPLAVAAVDATLEALQELEAPARARDIETAIRSGLGGCSRILEVRGRGALLGLVVSGDAGAARSALLAEHRVVVGGCPGDPSVLRLFPPVNIEEAALETGIAALREVLK